LHKAEIITWDDAHGTNSSIEIKDLKNTKPCRTHTIGFVVAENTHGVIISMDVYVGKEWSKHCNNYAFIPHGMIVSRREVT